MAIFKTKQMSVTADFWEKNGDHPFDGPASRDSDSPAEGKYVRYFRRPDIPSDHVCTECGKTAREHGWIDCEGDGIDVCPGMYIVEYGSRGTKPMIVSKHFIDAFFEETRTIEVCWEKAS